jgi:hypothetical protein
LSREIESDVASISSSIVLSSLILPELSQLQQQQQQQNREKGKGKAC